MTAPTTDTTGWQSIKLWSEIVAVEPIADCACVSLLLASGEVVTLDLDTSVIWHGNTVQ